MGGSSKPKQVGAAPLASPQQSEFINQILGGLAGPAAGAYGQFLQPYDPEQFQGLFQQAFIDPAMQAYEQQVIPSIQERFIGAQAGSSSALNQALASSAKDLSTAMGSQMGQFYQQQQQRQLGALGQLGGLSGQRILDPIIQKGYSPTGDVIGAGGRITAAAIPYILSAMSSVEYKENINRYEDGLDKVKALKVKKYDYKEEFGGHKDRIGLIAEEVPPELYISQNGYVGVDLYGLCSMLVKAVQNLAEKVEKLEVTDADST